MNTKRAALVLADGFEEVEAITPIDFLRRAGIEVVTLGVPGSSVTGGHDIGVHADKPINEFNAPIDAVILPGGMPGASNIASSDAAIKLIRKVNTEGGLVAAICAAPAVVLYPLGMLDGKKATCFPGFEKGLNKADFSDDRVVKDGNILTSQGAGTAAEFAEAIIAYLLGNDAAVEIHKRTLQKD